MTFDVTDRLELTAGVRYLYEERTSTYSAVAGASQILAGLGIPGVSLLGTVDTRGLTFRESDNFDAWLPRFNALYRISDAVNVYATVSKGRRAPVLNLSARATATGPVPAYTLVAQETVWNYEGGIKGAFGAFSGSVGAFYQDYSNFQTSFFNEQGQVVPVNAGSAGNFGVEVEGALRLSPNLRMFANYAFIDAKIESPNPAFQDNRFRLQSKHTAAAGIDVNVPVGDSAAIFFVPTVTYSSKQFFEIPNTPAHQRERLCAGACPRRRPLQRRCVRSHRVRAQPVQRKVPDRRGQHRRRVRHRNLHRRRTTHVRRAGRREVLIAA